MKTVEIVDTEDKVTVRINGVLVYNYHGAALKAIAMRYSRKHILSNILRDDPLLFDKFIEQLRNEGYFDESR